MLVVLLSSNSQSGCWVVDRIAVRWTCVGAAAFKLVQCEVPRRLSHAHLSC